MKIISTVAALCAAFILSTASLAQTKHPSITWDIPSMLQLWPEGAPYENGDVADITVYTADPEKNSGRAVLVLPGGGYGMLASDLEGHVPAKFLADNGVTAVMLRYRMPKGDRRVPISDVRQALKYIRDNAQTLGVNPDKVGIMGHSAGGHLAATASTHLDEQMPNFTILFYPVASFDSRYTHFGTVYNLLGQDKENHELLRKYSNELQITSSTPPAILLHSDDDTLVHPMNSILYYKALKENEIPAELVIYPSGGHGWGGHWEFPYNQDAYDRVLNFVLRQ